MSKQLTVEQGQAIAEQNLIRMYHESQADNARLRARLATIQKMVNEQAEDQGLWFLSLRAPEAYLQQELRRLHAVIEGAQEDGE